MKVDEPQLTRRCATCRRWRGKPIESVSWGAPMACNTLGFEACADWTPSTVGG